MQGGLFSLYYLRVEVSTAYTFPSPTPYTAKPGIVWFIKESMGFSLRLFIKSIYLRASNLDLQHKWVKQDF